MYCVVISDVVISGVHCIEEMNLTSCSTGKMQKFSSNFERKKMLSCFCSGEKNIYKALFYINCQSTDLFKRPHSERIIFFLHLRSNHQSSKRSYSFLLLLFIPTVSGGRPTTTIAIKKVACADKDENSTPSSPPLFYCHVFSPYFAGLFFRRFLSAW